MKSSNQAHKLLVPFCILCILIITLTQSPSLKDINTILNPSKHSTQAYIFSHNSYQKLSKVHESDSLPKYIFLFIADGVSFPQIQLTSNYLGLKEDSSSYTPNSSNLSFMNFPYLGTATTYNSNSYITDSASAGTAISSGYKTKTGILNMSPDFSTAYETIAETLKQRFGYHIGIVSSANINHATPAAFYAHQSSRKNYYEIGKELIASNFDYFAGGDFRNPTGDDPSCKLTDLHDLAKDSGYKVLSTTDSLDSLTTTTSNIILTSSNLADSSTIPYRIDATDTDWSLADYVTQGIAILSKRTPGFFFAIEGGKTDWASHANDTATMIHELLDFDRSVKVALEFYMEHPTETLILVTGDHETGGLSIGYTNTNYETYLTNLMYQTISFDLFDRNYVTQYQKDSVSFPRAMEDVSKLFGLTLPNCSRKDSPQTLTLTEEEAKRLQTAYNLTLEIYNDPSLASTSPLYESYSPFLLEILNLLNHKSGISYSTYYHTGLPVPVYAIGCGSDKFAGNYDNTSINPKIMELFSKP